MNLNTYRKSPVDSYNLSTLEAICKERIQLYKILETAKLYIKQGTTYWSKYVISEIRSLKLNIYCTLLNSEPCQGLLRSRIEDNIAHWIVGLCYCQTTELQYLFIDWELQWFHIRFINSEKSDREVFLIKNNLMCTTLEVLERLLLYDDLIGCTEVNKNDYNDITFYKAKFYEIPEVVSRREAFVEDGIAIFSENNYIYYIKNKLRKEFSDRLKFQSKVISGANDHFQFLIRSIPTFVPKLNMGCEVDAINLESIDQIAKYHFPLCMRHLHNTLRAEHHLKYDCRMQYGIFLFWLGLSYEDALEFWKDEFEQKMTKDNFERRYSYLFKHQYGIVGRKRPYVQLSCSKILTYSPLPMQHHGCPFKHWSKSVLLKTIEGDVSCLKDIEDLVDQNKYQKACAKYFCSSRNVDKYVFNIEKDVIESPNQYVHESFSVCDVLDRAFVDIGLSNTDCYNLDPEVQMESLNLNIRQLEINKD